MSAQETGGPAFPSPDLGQMHFGGSDGRAAYPGMTLRDHFATHAMQSALLTCGLSDVARNSILDSLDKGESVEDHISCVAYAIADAMLKARLK